jgi:hypothetical protein
MADIRLAVNSGEVTGVVNAWESFKSTWRKELESGDVTIVLQNIPKAHPDLPKVPLAVNLVKTDEDRKLLHVGAHSLGPTARPYVLPPGTPKERVQMLRRAFMDTMKDAEFLAEAKKARLDIYPEDGAALERNVKEIFNLEPKLIDAILQPDDLRRHPPAPRGGLNRTSIRVAARDGCGVDPRAEVDSQTERDPQIVEKGQCPLLWLPTYYMV